MELSGVRHTSWCYEVIALHVPTLAVIKQCHLLPFATSFPSSQSGIFIVQWHLEWRLRCLVARSLWLQSFDTLIQWFSSCGGLLLVDRILIVRA